MWTQLWPPVQRIQKLNSTGRKQKWIVYCYPSEGGTRCYPDVWVQKRTTQFPLLTESILYVDFWNCYFKFYYYLHYDLEILKLRFNHSLHLNFGFLCLNLDHGSGQVVVNLDSHSFLPYLLCLYPNHVIYTTFDVKTLVHLLNQTLARKL